MKFGKVTLAAVALAAATAPIAGQAIAAERASQPLSGQNSLGDSPYGILILLALVGLAVGIASGGDDDPVSA